MGSHSPPRKGSLAFTPIKRSKKQIPSRITSVHPGLAYSYYIKIGMTQLPIQERVLPVTVLQKVPLKKLDTVYYDAEGYHTTKDKAVRASLRVALDYTNTNHPRKNNPESRNKIIRQIPYIGSIESAQAAEDLSLPTSQYVDVVGVTKGKGFSGVVKRRGVKLQPRKASGRRRHTGALGTRQPGKLDFRRPLPGQLGYARRTILNCYMVKTSKQSINLPNYGASTQELMYVKGSVTGPVLRTVAVRPALRR